MIKAVAILLAAAVGATPPAAPVDATVDGPFVRLRAGDSFDCLNDTGCIAMTPEYLQQLLARAALSCRKPLSL